MTARLTKRSGVYIAHSIYLEIRAASVERGVSVRSLVEASWHHYKRITPNVPKRDASTAHPLADRPRIDDYLQGLGEED